MIESVLPGTAVPAFPRLLADVGGTNARFAWQAAAGAPMTDVMTLPTADHASLGDAMRAWLARTGHAVPPQCAVAIATAVVGDDIRMTNHAWAFTVPGLRADLGFQRLLVLNDFTALAMALPGLAPSDLRHVRGGEPVADAAIALIGAGTGLGVSGLLADGHGGWRPLQGEGGHATLAGRTPREQAVLNVVDAQYGHISAERVCSGQGIVDIHRALQVLDQPGQAPQPREAAAITAAALDGSDARCVEAVELFCAFLGTAAGNLALTLGARGGVYIGGGIVPRLGGFFDRSPFAERFLAKGRFRALLEGMPVKLIVTAESPAFLGASRALDGRA